MKFKRPDAIAQLMGKAGRQLPAATAAFRDLAVAAPDARPELLDRLHAIEEEADVQNAKFIRKVTSTFVTPFDREDLYAMIERIDDVIDGLDHVGSLILGFKLGELPGELVTNAELLVEMSELCAQAPDLIKKPKKLDALLADIDKVENRLDLGHEQLLITYLVPDADPIQAIRVKVLADGLEVVATAMEEFVLALGVTAIKET